MAKRANLAAALQEVSGKPVQPEPKPQEAQQVETLKIDYHQAGKARKRSLVILTQQSPDN